MIPRLAIILLYLLTLTVFTLGSTSSECYSGWTYLYSRHYQQGECLIVERVWVCSETGEEIVCGQYVYCNDERGSYDIECPLDY